MPQFSIKVLAKIIERDSKDGTYKYALLRGSIDIILENDNYRKIRSIAFRREFEKVISFYSGAEHSYPLFYDLKRGISRRDLGEAVWQLVRNNLILQPMRYIGCAIDRGGEIYRYTKDAKRTRVSGYLSIESIIDALGTFSIPIELYHVMQVVGSFVTGTHSLIFRWAEFTSGIANDPDISTSKMISLLKSDFNERDIALLGHTAFSPKGWKNDSYEQLIRISHL